MSSSTAPTFAALLEQLPPDPAPAWPPVPATPAEPNHSFEQRRTDGTGQLVWTRPMPAGATPGALWVEHRQQFSSTGLWPLLVDDAFWEAVELEPFEMPAFPDTVTLLRRLVEDYAGIDLVPRGPRPDRVDDERSPEQVVDAYGEATTLLLVPTRAGWLVPQLLGWDGSVNLNLMGSEHTAVLGRWAGLFGAELYALGRDVLQLLVRRPPVEDLARLSAAAEIYAYCPDAVDQGVETLDALTAVAGSREWSLWWD